MGDEPVERAIGAVPHAIVIAGEERDPKALGTGRGRLPRRFPARPTQIIVAYQTRRKH
jgi:hypothetical protein